MCVLESKELLFDPLVIIGFLATCWIAGLQEGSICGGWKALLVEARPSFVILFCFGFVANVILDSFLGCI